MRVLAVHNYAGDFAFGGEGAVFEEEAGLLRVNGHDVRQYVRTNSEVSNAPFLEKLAHVIHSGWSQRAYREMMREIRYFKPDVLHVHNIFYLITPSVFRAAVDCGVPVVLTLHNYRLICPASQVFRGGQVCDTCHGINPWRILLYRCYRGSLFASMLRYNVYYLSQQLHKWFDDISIFIALTSFARDKVIQSGLPADRVVVKPNAVGDRWQERSRGTGSNDREGAVFVGRLSEEKGLFHLLRAWEAIEYPLTIVGDGPLRSRLNAVAPRNVRFTGRLGQEGVYDELARSAFCVLPSLCYEGCPLAIIEGFSFGLPVVASRLGGMAAMIDDGVTGLLVEPNCADDLRRQVLHLIGNKKEIERMGARARAEYLSKYTPDRNYETLMAIYQKARSGGRTQSAGEQASACSS